MQNLSVERLGPQVRYMPLNEAIPTIPLNCHPSVPDPDTGGD